MSLVPIVLYAEHETAIRSLFDAQPALQIAGSHLQLQRSKRSLGLMKNSETAFQIGLQLSPHTSSMALAEFIWQSLCERGKNVMSLNNEIVSDQASLQQILQQTMAQLWPQSGLHLLSLHLPEFGSLRNFVLDFSDYMQDEDGGWCSNRLHALISVNAADQISLLQALLQIFQGAAANCPATFAYRLRYRMHGHLLQLVAQPGEVPQCEMDDKPVPLPQLRAEGQTLLPARIVLQGALPGGTVSQQASPIPVLNLEAQAGAGYVAACVERGQRAFQDVLERITTAADQIGMMSTEQARIATMAGSILAADQDQTQHQAWAADLIILFQPESGLHPQWQVRYARELAAALAASADGGGPILLATQAPLLLADLQRAQLRLIESDGGQSRGRIPAVPPQGMGVAGLLKSEIFGLASTLDQRTLGKLQQRNALLARQAQTGLNEQEARQLQALRDTLEQLGFVHESSDPLYALFLQNMQQARQLPLTQLLSAEELAEQTRLAQEITRRLLAQEQNGKLAQLAQELRALDGE